MPSTLSNQLALLFEARGYTWKIGGELKTPNAEDIEKVLADAKKSLDSQEGDDLQLEVGRLIIRKTAGHYDLYVLFGELDD